MCSRLNGNSSDAPRCPWWGWSRSATPKNCFRFEELARKKRCIWPNVGNFSGLRMSNRAAWSVVFRYAEETSREKLGQLLIITTERWNFSCRTAIRLAHACKTINQSVNVGKCGWKFWFGATSASTGRYGKFRSESSRKSGSGDTGKDVGLFAACPEAHRYARRDWWWTTHVNASARRRHLRIRNRERTSRTYLAFSADSPVVRVLQVHTSLAFERPRPITLKRKPDIVDGSCLVGNDSGMNYVVNNFRFGGLNGPALAPRVCSTRVRTLPIAQKLHSEVTRLAGRVGRMRCARFWRCRGGLRHAKLRSLIGLPGPVADRRTAFALFQLSLRNYEQLLIWWIVA